MDVLSPILSVDVLHNALERLSRSDQLEDSVFSSFVMVHRRINSPDLPLTERTLEYVVQDLLYSFVVDDLVTLHHVHGLPIPEFDVTVESAVSSLQLCAAVENELLNGCVATFYQYFHPELGWSTDDIAELLYISARSVRRYRKRYLVRLHDVVVASELETRSVMRSLLSSLSLQRQGNFLSFFASEVKYGFSVLSDYAQHHPLWIYGPPQIGKSSLALQIARKLVDNGTFARVILLDLQSAEATPQRLSHLVASQLQTIEAAQDIPPLYTIRQHLSLQTTDQRMLLVLDNANAYCEAIQTNFDWLSHFTLIVTANERPTVWPGATIRCPSISLEDTSHLLISLHERFFQHKSMGDIDSYAEFLWQKHDGNVGKITYAFQLQYEIPLNDNLRTYTISDTLSDEAQRLLVLLLLLEQLELVTYPKLINYSQKLFGYTEHKTQRLVVELRDYDVIHVDYKLTNYVYRVQRKPEIDSEAQVAVIATIIANDVSKLAFCAFKTDQLLSPVLRQLQSLIKKAHTYVVQQSYWLEWEAILNRLLNINDLSDFNNIILHIELGVVHRWRGQFISAQDHLMIAWQQAKAIEHPLLIAEALREQSIAGLYQNEANAQDKAYEAFQLFHQHGTVSDIDHARIVLARALQQNDPHYALEILEQVKKQDSAYWSLAAKIHMSMNDLPAAQQAARASVVLLDQTDVRYARALALLAQIHVLMQEFELARNTYESALNVAQQHYDIVALARLYFNYAYFLFKVDNHRDAHKHMLRAIYLQEQLQDTHALDSAGKVLQLIEEALAER